MKKLLLILLFVPLVSSGQNLIEDNIKAFKESLKNSSIYNPSPKSFFKGWWIDTSGILKLAVISKFELLYFFHLNHSLPNH
jgi:hypothetical protein